MAADPALAVLAWLMMPHDVHEFPSLEDLLRRPKWMRRAACRGAGAHEFVIGRGGDYGPARQLCAGCAVRSECLGYAMADDSLVGIWGGTSTAERVRMRKLAG